MAALQKLLTLWQRAYKIMKLRYSVKKVLLKESDEVFISFLTAIK